MEKCGPHSVTNNAVQHIFSVVTCTEASICSCISCFSGSSPNILVYVVMSHLKLSEAKWGDAERESQGEAGRVADAVLAEG